MNLILFGFKGCGKTHFGRLLARKMGRPFIDTDDLIGERPKELYKKLGREEFRALEKRALQTIKVEGAVIAVGGGTVLDPENVELLQKLGQLVYLRTDAGKLKERIFKGELPAFLEGEDPEGAFWQMIREREPIYRSIRARCVDTDALDEDGIIKELIDGL